MSRCSRPVRITVLLSAADHRVYESACRILMRIMGAQAPDVIGLIHQNLCGRDPRGLADEYLDTVGWPMAGNRTVTLRRRRAAAGKARSGREVFSPRLLLPSPRGFLDPTRN